MSKFDLPDLPSDDELGITEEDRRAFEEDLPADRPEMSEDEMAALLGGTPEPAPGEAASVAKAKKPKKEKKAKDKAKPGVAEHATTTGPRSRWRGPVTLLALVGLTALSSTRAALPRPVPANASDTVFSSARAMSLVTEIARRPHPPGSPEHARVLGYLVERLRGLGLDPEVQTATSFIQRGEAARAATVRNVVARIPGTASTGAVLATAHYDSRELAPGAGDDATGVATILEAVRALRTGPPLRNDVIVLLTDAEELGLLGAEAFVGQHPWIADVAVVLAFDMRGGGGPSLMFETNAENGWIIRALDDFDPEPFANSLFAEIYERMPNDTDFTPFKSAGKQGLNFASIGDAHVYHQATDTPGNLSEATLQHHGARALAALRYLGGADLADVRAPDVVYFSLPVVGLVVYGGGWVLPLTGALIVLLLLTVLAARRTGARLGGVVTGLGVAIVGGSLSYGAGLGILAWVSRFHPEGGSLDGSLYHREGWYVVALVAAVFAIVTALHSVARRFLSQVELSLGAVLVPLGLAVGLTFVTPLGAMDAQWPVAAALLATLVLALLGPRAAGVVGWLVSLALVTPVLALMVPMTELLWLSMTLQLLAWVGVTIALTLHMSLPALEGLRQPNGWWAPLAAAALVPAALWVGVSSARTTEANPAPSTLIYAYEHGSGSAHWVTDPGADILLDAEAIAWAEERAGAPFGATEDMTPFGLPWRQAPVAVAPVIEAPPPEVVVVRDTVEAGTRRVTLALRSRIGAERLTFHRDPGSRVRILSLQGERLEQPANVVWVDHWGVPDSMVVVELDMPESDPIGIHVVEDHLRPQELLGADAFRRPAHLAPDVRARSDRALLSYSIAAFADPRHAFAPSGAAAPPVPAADSAVASPDSAGAPSDSARAPGATR